MKAYKLVRMRKDGSLGPLFIDAKLRLTFNEVLKAKAVPTTGFAFRPGWHTCAKPLAPHLSKKGRCWIRVEISGKIKKHHRPQSQGGLWYTSSKMKVLKVLNNVC
jgi:hypothetical protein